MNSIKESYLLRHVCIIFFKQIRYGFQRIICNRKSILFRSMLKFMKIFIIQQLGFCWIMLLLQFVVISLLNITDKEANTLNLVYVCLIENKNS